MYLHVFAVLYNSNKSAPFIFLHLSNTVRSSLRYIFHTLKSHTMARQPPQQGQHPPSIARSHQTHGLMAGEPSAAKPSTTKSFTAEPATKKPASNKPSASKPSAQESSAREPSSSKKPIFGEPSGDKPSVAPEKQRAELSATEMAVGPVLWPGQPPVRTSSADNSQVFTTNQYVYLLVEYSQISETVAQS